MVVSGKRTGKITVVGSTKGLAVVVVVGACGVRITIPVNLAGGLVLVP